MVTVTVRIGKKDALYLPRDLVRALGLREGEKVQLTVDGDTVRMTIIRNPLRLALKGRKFARVCPNEVEAISLEEQSRHAASSSDHRRV